MFRKMTLDEINRKIKEYPQPISGCDAQFTWLLQQRENILGHNRKIIDRIENDHKYAVNTEINKIKDL